MAIIIMPSAMVAGPPSLLLESADFDFA
jgi:hypothetical protein